MSEKSKSLLMMGGDLLYQQTERARQTKTATLDIIERAASGDFSDSDDVRDVTAAILAAIFTVVIVLIFRTIF